MARLTRAQQQERTRAAVLDAAHREFAEHGYDEAKVDRIADRAELTRGAVYSNFPSKRALYLAVLIDLIERPAQAVAPARPPGSPVQAVGRFARVWLERLPLAGDPASGGRLRLRSLTGVLDDPARSVLAQLLDLESLLLGLALEAGDAATTPPRRVRVARLVLTLLHGAGSLAEAAPGHGDPFDVIRACEQLARIELSDGWDPPHRPYVPPAREADDGWTPPAGLIDRLAGGPVDLGADGAIVVLGAGRLAAAEEAVRSRTAGEQVTIVAVTADPAETGRLVRAHVADLAGCLREAVGTGYCDGLHLVLDDDGTVGRALGLGEPGDDTELAVHVHAGRVVTRAEGRGAGLAAACTAASSASAG